ncbi:hypothetical protein [Allochromatium tepidum]|uniref:Uncharacterized protein n=1 Tax=Allochromatium tepidum TaxID=553982 RepID=A0ABM7QMV2_9GAMM|nr:hypothetical protein [Allochromatium tepidum]BCU07062.1 hypothetical protein Atep_17390 [Allochromatium tepidum]
MRPNANPFRRPESAALREAERTRGELEALGVQNLHLALNGVLDAGDSDDPRGSGDGATRRGGSG